MLEPVRPPRFREPVEIHGAKLTGECPSFAVRTKMPTGARGQGIRYERKVQTELLRQFPQNYVPSPWFRFFDSHGLRWCQPDGLLMDIKQGLLTVVEVKHHHTGEAWWKLHKLYLPVVRAVFGPEWKFSCLEVVRFYEPEELFPFAKLCEHPHLCPPLPFTGVHILKPRSSSE